MRTLSAFMFCLALAGRVSGETQSTQHRVVLIDISPSMKPYRSQQLEALKTVIEKWEPCQTIDFLAIDGNPLGRAPLGHMPAFPYNGKESNPTRYRLETTVLRKKYLATILPAIEQAIASEDEKNKRNPNLADTCLVDSLEAAARAFRFVPSQSRELMLLTDGYEDCKESIHLPREKLSPARIEAIVHQFERQNRLPHFAAPVTAYFVGTRQNSTTSRSYEDLVEQLWIRLLSQCGVQLRSENFSPTLSPRWATAFFPQILWKVFPIPIPQGETMPIWKDNMVLLHLNGRERLVLKTLFDGTIICGAKGSGKSSASGAHLLACLLDAQCGGAVALPKPTDFKDAIKLIRRHGREQDVILMRPTADWTETPINAINVLDAEQKLFGHGKANVANVTALLMKTSDLIQRQGGQGSSNEAFWRSFAERIVRAGLAVQSIISNRFDLKLLLKFCNTLPNTLPETESDNLYAVAQVQEAAAKLGENPPYEFTGLVFDFVMREWPLLHPQGRASGLLTVQTMLNTLVSHPLRQMLFETSTFDLDQVLNHGGILLLDMDVQTYPQGAIAGMILKDLIARACQARPELSTLEPHLVQPCFLFYDEYPRYAIDADEMHAQMGRSARLIPIFMTQTTTSLKAVFQDKDRAQNLLDLAGCRWAHQNGSWETNEWMSKTIGQVIVKRQGGQTGTQTTFGPQVQWGNNQGQNYTEQLDYDFSPRRFTGLLRGGPENNFRSEAVFWRNGDRFGWNGRRWLPVVFPQNFKPGRDEVSLAAQKGGINLVRKVTSKLSDFGSAAKVRWI